MKIKFLFLFLICTLTINAQRIEKISQNEISNIENAVPYKYVDKNSQEFQIFKEVRGSGWNYHYYLRIVNGNSYKCYIPFIQY